MEEGGGGDEEGEEKREITSEKKKRKKRSVLNTIGNIIYHSGQSKSAIDPSMRT